MSEDIARFVDNLTHEPTQVSEHSVDLTVSAIYTVSGAGRIDFGGSELEDADLEPVDLEQAADDDYGWWELSAGQYVVQFNEFLSDVDRPLLLQPKNELLARGGSHPALRIRSHLPLVPLSVGGDGLAVKENARITTVAPWGDSRPDGPVDAT